MSVNRAQLINPHGREAGSAGVMRRCGSGFSREWLENRFGAKAPPAVAPCSPLRRVVSPLKKSDVRIRFAVPAFGWGFSAMHRKPAHEGL